MTKGLTDRIQSVMGSWWFLLAFLSWTILWWIGLNINDAWPWVGWATITTLLTQVDVIVVKIGQRQQQKTDAERMTLLLRMAKNQDHLLEAAVVTLEAVENQQSQHGQILADIDSELEELHDLERKAHQRIDKIVSETT